MRRLRRALGLVVLGLRASRRAHPGQALVETALTIVVFLTATMGLMDFGRAAYTYNAISNLAREASHYAMVEYTSDPSSACYWNTINQSNCVEAIKSYLTSLNMVPGVSASSISVDMSVGCGGSVSCTPGIPIDVSLSTHFSPVALALVGIQAFNISATSTNQFVLPGSATATPTATPSTTATPLPTPTVVPEGPPTNVSVAASSNCSNNCEEFTISWTPPANVAALGHYDIRQTVGGVSQYDDPIPAQLGSYSVSSTTEDLGSTTNAVCFDVIAVFTDASTWTGTGSWHNGQTAAPSCAG